MIKQASLTANSFGSIIIAETVDAKRESGDAVVHYTLMILRVFVGLLIVKTGADLIRGDLVFSGFSEHQPVITGIFTILIGIHIIFSSIFNSS